MCCTVWNRFLFEELCEKAADTRRHVSNQATTLEVGCQRSALSTWWQILIWLTFTTGHMEKYIEVEENFWGAERGAHVRTSHLFHPVCISLGTTGFALGFLFLEFGLWCLFGFLLCFLVRCLEILISFSFSCRCWPTMSRTRPAMQKKKKSSCHRYLEPNGFSAPILLFRAPLITRLRNGSLFSDAFFRGGFLFWDLKTPFESIPPGLKKTPLELAKTNKRRLWAKTSKCRCSESLRLTWRMNCYQIGSWEHKLQTVLGSHSRQLRLCAKQRATRLQVS